MGRPRRWPARAMLHRRRATTPKVAATPSGCVVKSLPLLRIDRSGPVKALQLLSRSDCRQTRVYESSLIKLSGSVALGAEQGDQPVLVEHLHPEPLGVGEL